MTSLTTNRDLPKRGEIWLVNFDPTIGAEIRKVRPAVVISSDAVGKLPIKLIAPVTDWKTYFLQNFWNVKIEPDTTNSLTKISAIDVLQLRGVDLQRFIRKLGDVSEMKMSEINAAILAVIEWEF
ncbi:type II toxin-antitoxin system PemK/MazF family toxin [Cuspidothrix issatschenkoi]|uniref:type II toxin-antitoxin system PemK/MazF family toxin n=1 Tax=Cuspidothrix issatschenkoi TaxID=230752 RepID=UPI0026BD84F8